MTKQEYSDLYDALYYGHDAELDVHNRRFFIEWNDAGIDIYALNRNSGEKIAVIYANEKSEVLAELFAYRFDGNINLNEAYDEIILVDIE